MVLGTVWDILYAKIFVANISLSPTLIFFCPNIVSSARLLSIFLFFDSLVLTVTLYIEFGRLCSSLRSLFMRSALLSSFATCWAASFFRACDLRAPPIQFASMDDPGAA